MYGINLNPILPVRVKPAEQAEMCTQLLFGETFSILDTTEKWCFIHNNADQYEGWIDKKMITYIDEKEFRSLTSYMPIQIFKPVAECFISNKKERFEKQKHEQKHLSDYTEFQKTTHEIESILLPAGSCIHSYNNETGIVSVKENIYTIPADAIMKRASQPASGNLIASIAKSFLNAPYLWGGKTIFGIDCSGLVQVCFSICGIRLSRDANQQALEGESVNSLQEANTGDLAFFENDKGEIIHVGIIFDNSTIIHASGKVKIDSIDPTGIISRETGKYTHQLSLIKRFTT